MDKNYNIIEVNELVKEVILNNFSEIRIKGEVSNIKAYNNTIYLTLKDLDPNHNSVLNCCIWDKNKVNLQGIENGKSVYAKGKITAYVKGGSYQFIITNIRTKRNQEENALTLLKDHYNKLGYFSDQRKKQIKLKINNICIITAISGAAIKDMLHVFEENNYIGKISIKNSAVQGTSCPDSISNALLVTDAMNFDIIIVTRGGGTYEDLNGFNDKKIIEQVYLMKTLVISAIGHEVDNVLLDYVADVRASTPTRAAEIVCSVQKNIISIDILQKILDNSKQKIISLIKSYKSKVDILKLKLDNHYNIINNLEQILTTVKNNIVTRILNYGNKLTQYKYLLEKNKPAHNHMILNYRTNKLVHTMESYLKSKEDGDQILLLFSDGCTFI